MTMIFLTLAPLLALQASGETAIAIENDNPETWTVEYPRLIQHEVDTYRGCLNMTDRMVRGVADFEQQHASDLPRCANARASAVEQSNARLVGSKTEFTAEQVAEVFDRIGAIHQARGRDLDQQFTQRVTQVAAAQKKYEERPPGLVIELRDASVIQAQADALNANSEDEIR